MKKQWWEVRTGNSNDERSSDGVLLGTFYGYADEIALRLAHKQRGFWCDGKLTFTKTSEPKTILPKKVHQSVNVVFDGMNWNNGPDLLRRMKQAFKGRPVTVSENNQYGAVTLHKRDKKPRTKR